MSVKPFTIKIPQATLDDLQQRLANTRWLEEVEGAGWDYGTNLAYLQELVAYWKDEFDWRAQEAALNNFDHFRANIDGFGLHFIHARGKGENPLPILLLHGWPDSFLRMAKLIPMLTDPEKYGGKPEDSFDVIVPSLPGFGFSDRPKTRDFGGPQTIQLLTKLMTEELGYARFAVHGGDVGSGVTEWLARMAPDNIMGIHLTDIPYWHIFTVQPDELSQTEQGYLAAGQQWQMSEGAYALIQATKPQTLAFGLNDSPVGLAAWIVEKFRAWSDCNGDVEKRFTKDELLTNITLYWVTSTISSSFLAYYQGGGGEAQTGGDQASAEQAAQSRVEVPTGVAIFPKDIVPAPREFGERIFNIQRWTKMPRGGHFAALEEPELLAEDLRAFFYR